jgi:hypothetical protein
VLNPGDTIGDWVVDEPLGEGGMGTVYRAHSALVARLEAALKVLRPTSEPDARARFVREAEALSALRHPAIVRVMGFNEDRERGLLYLAMELVPGETLRSRLDRGPLSVDEASRIFLPLASALEHAHEAGIFHRDIKPANIILSRDGTVRLVDFGIAVTVEGGDTTANRRGTISYLPPEVFAGRRLDPAAADVYGLGLLLHESLTGAKAFPVEPGLTPAAAAPIVGRLKLASGALDPGPSFPDALREVVRRSTDPDPQRRPTAHEFRVALAGVAGAPGVDHDAGDAAAAAPFIEEEQTTRVPEPARPPQPPPRLLARAAVVVAALAFATAGALALRGRGTEAVDRVPAKSRASGAPPPAVPATREDREPKRDADRTVNLAGVWEMLNEVEASDYRPFRGLRLGYLIALRQSGDKLSGEGYKVAENDVLVPRSRRAPLLLTGEVRGSDVELQFVERGAQRNSAGTLRWRVSDDGGAASGTFTSDVSSTRGTSRARRR